MKTYYCIFVLLFLISCQEDSKENVRIACDLATLEQTPINEFQVIGTHNSYRKRTYAPLFNLLSLASTVLPDNLWLPENMDPAIEWDYDHVSFQQQFNQYHVRSLEIDLYNDKNGGLFANRLGNAIVGQPIASGEPALNEPGIKVMHIPHLDYMTHYLTFKESLTAILEWSNENPNHFPVSVMLEIKEIDFPDIIEGITEPFESDEDMKAIAQTILSVFPREQLITPKDLRTHLTLETSIQVDGWPTLAESRGKVMFIVMGKPEIEKTIFGSNSDLTNNDNYLFKILNDPEGDFNEIKEAVRKGFMVRTRADAGTKQARSGDVTDRDLAFESGAQIISTDYYRPDPRYVLFPNAWSNYKVQWSGDNVARTNTTLGCYINENLSD